MAIKKPIQKRLDNIASKLPLVFKIEDDVVPMTGKELKLTPLGDELSVIDTEIYNVPVPKMVAVFHDQQVKDAFKRGGAKEVETYVNMVMQQNSTKYLFVNNPETGGQFIAI